MTYLADTVTLTGAQTLTNKTITSAAFSGTQTGDFTTTGNITIDSAGNAEFYVDSAAGNLAEVGFRDAGVDRWVLRNQTTDAFTIDRYVSGSFQDSALSIANATGNVTIANALTVNGGASLYRNDTELGAYLTIEQDGTGDASMQFLLTETRAWSVGIDNSDSDSFKISPNAALDSGTAITITTGGDVTVAGALSKGSGSFKIDHPLKPETHHLVHSFIEGPQADNIYRGKVRLINGKATVNLDEAGRMTEGTFVALNTNVQCFTSNEEGWTPLRGSVNGNMLTIEAQDQACTDEVSWLVIGERHDKHMLETDWTDENGRVITEPPKEYINGSI